MIDPGDMDAVDRRTFDHILEYGHQVLYVGRGDDSPAIAYTVGRSMKDRPELLIVGDMHPQVMQTLLNDLADIDDREPLTLHPILGTLVLDGLIRDYSAHIVRADPVAAEMNMALRFFGDKVTALQVLWPDTEGRFPGESGFSLTQPTFPL